ncbi:MAG: hypothetical protein IPM29_12600 [Planctomycetes bacterium]|nr:hypothetical protein [Planctomycetota bacterium]
MVRVSELDREVVELFERSLNPQSPTLWGSGFDAAQGFGTSVGPLLRRMEDGEADPRRRLLLLAAWSIAEGPGATGELVRRLQPPPGRTADARERLVLLVALALGEPRAGPAPELEHLVTRASDPIYEAAACFAAARFPDIEGPPARWARDRQQPGRRAAARFARRAERPLEDIDLALRGDEAVQLAVRADLLRLGALGFDEVAVRRYAGLLGTRNAGSGALARCAAVALAQEIDAGAWLDALGTSVVDARVAATLVSSPGFRRELYRRGVLAAPPAWLEPIERGRIALAAALETDLETLAAGRGEWERDPEIARILCLGLAWRLLGPGEPVPAAWFAAAPQVRERAWVGFACGLEAPADSQTFDDPELDRAWLLASRGGRELLPAAAARGALEDALWRRQAHPALSRPQAEADLLHDALLAGSERGATVLGVGRDGIGRLLPKGLDPASHAFTIAYELWSYLRAPGPRRPSTARLQ